jgi:hypothetical protein
MKPVLRLLPVVAIAFGAVACGGDDSESSPSSTASRDATGTTAESGASTPGAAGYLTSVCPDPIKIQLQWYPQPDPYAMAFGLIADGELNEATAGYSGAAIADPDQTIEIIGGGPLAGYQSTTSLMYANPDILLGDMNLDESIANSKTFPTVGVIGPFLKSPLALMFNPEVHDFETIEDVKAAGTTVLVTQSAVFAQAMIGLGLLDESQVDFSFDFGPARFVDTNGDVAQQSFTTHDPYEYLHADFWGEPVEDVLLADSYPTYQNVLTVTPTNLAAEADCLERLVPLLQQSMVDYMADPAAINELMVGLSSDLDNPANFSPESLQFTTDAMRDSELLGNTEGTTTFGSFDLERVAYLVEILTPVFDGQQHFDPAVTAAQLATNEFIDPTIGFDE